MPKRVTKYGIWRDGRRIHRLPGTRNRLPLMSKATAESIARSFNSSIHFTGNYEARPVRETVKSGFKARNRRSARTEALLRRE